MTKLPESVADFLSGRRIAVAGVSRTGASAGNPVFRKLRKAGYETFPVNPKASEVEGVRCYPDVASVPGPLDGVVVATHPRDAITLVRQCGDAGVTRVWFHRAFGDGSVSAEAVEECRVRGLRCIVGGCPLMYCEPIDFGHKCMRWWLGRRARVPS
jgi:predicted CoA-binding protein